MTRYRHKNYSNRLPISRQRRGRNRGATHLSAASARDLRAYCHTPSDRSNVFSDSTMMIREYCDTPIQIKAKFIYNHLISSEINRASGYNSCNPALTASAAMPATWGKGNAHTNPQPWSGCRPSSDK